MPTSPLKSIFLIALVFFTSSFAESHKFYVSVTNVSFSEKDSSLQVISRLFIDDLDALLEERYGLDARLNTPDESDQADAYIERYFREKFELTANGISLPHDFLGKRYENDLVICYLEAPLGKTAPRSIGIQNAILTDLFEEQKNLVHLDYKGIKKSFVLIRENNKGMLNLE